MLITLDMKNESKEAKKQSKNNENKFSNFAGMWENRDINIDTIRDSAWQR